MTQDLVGKPVFFLTSMVCACLNLSLTFLLHGNKLFIYVLWLQSTTLSFEVTKGFPPSPLCSSPMLLGPPHLPSSFNKVQHLSKLTFLMLIKKEQVFHLALRFPPSLQTREGVILTCTISRINGQRGQVHLHPSLIPPKV